MAEAFQFELVSPERLLVSEKIESVVIPATEGEMTIMANHAPVIGGFADILPAGCTLLAESAVSVKDLDRDDIARRVQEAKEDVADARDDNTRTRAEQYLSELTTLQGALQAA
jgi:F-type H+-transporting ATPase subunit epsilon